MKQFNAQEAMARNKAQWNMTDEQAYDIHELAWDTEEITDIFDLDAWFDSITVDSVDEDELVVTASEYERGDITLTIRPTDAIVKFSDELSYEEWGDVLDALRDAGPGFYELYAGIETSLEVYDPGHAYLLSFECSIDAYKDYVMAKEQI